jgi:hypothetical protein
LIHDGWFRQKVKTGLDQLDQGKFVSHEEIGARIDSDIPFLDAGPLVNCRGTRSIPYY